MKATVAERGQVTIPKRLRDRLGIRHGTVLEFQEDADGMRVVKADGGDAVARLFGRFSKRRRTDEILRGLRGRS
jgi:AbrB family looped-hinge helix DNA binding protein